MCPTTWGSAGSGHSGSSGHSAGLLQRLSPPRLLYRVRKGQCRSSHLSYYGWAYRLDGSLRRALRLGKLENFKVDEFGLNTVELEVWAGLMFVHFAKPSQGMAATYPGLKAADLESLQYVTRRSDEPNAIGRSSWTTIL